MPVPPPARIRYHRFSKVLEVAFPDQAPAELSAEFLRVHSPSAEVQGHGGGEGMLVGGKRAVGITKIEPVGHYAIRIHFDDGHNTGLYTWPILADMISNHDSLWARYLERLTQHGMSREPGAVTKLSVLLETKKHD